MRRTEKEYLGDAVYAEVYDGQLVLTTEAGLGCATNMIYLEPEVVVALERYIARVRGEEQAIG